MIPASLRSFFRREEGFATAEVAILFPIILWPFMMAMEVSFMQIRQAMLERGMDIVVRDLRLGDPALEDPDALKEAVCSEILVMPDCLDDIHVEMEPVDIHTFNYEGDTLECVDRTQEVNPVTTYEIGDINEMMLLQFCVLHDPILPGVGVGQALRQVEGGGVPLVASTVFVNEPS